MPKTCKGFCKEEELDSNMSRSVDIILEKIRYVSYPKRAAADLIFHFDSFSLPHLCHRISSVSCCLDSEHAAEEPARRQLVIRHIVHEGMGDDGGIGWHCMERGPMTWPGIAGWAHAGGDLVDSSGRPTRRISPWCQAGFCRGDDSDW